MLYQHYQHHQHHHNFVLTSASQLALFLLFHLLCSAVLCTLCIMYLFVRILFFSLIWKSLETAVYAYLPTAAPRWPAVNERIKRLSKSSSFVCRRSYSTNPEARGTIRHWLGQLAPSFKHKASLWWQMQLDTMINSVLLFPIRSVAVAANQMLFNFSYYTALQMSALECVRVDCVWVWIKPMHCRADIGLLLKIDMCSRHWLSTFWTERFI